MSDKDGQAASILSSWDSDMNVLRSLHRVGTEVSEQWREASPSRPFQLPDWLATRTDPLCTDSLLRGI